MVLLAKYSWMGCWRRQNSNHSCNLSEDCESPAHCPGPHHTLRLSPLTFTWMILVWQKYDTDSPKLLSQQPDRHQSMSNTKYVRHQFFSSSNVLRKSCIPHSITRFLPAFNFSSVYSISMLFQTPKYSCTVFRCTAPKVFSSFSKEYGEIPTWHLLFGQLRIYAYRRQENLTKTELLTHNSSSYAF